MTEKDQTRDAGESREPDDDDQAPPSSDERDEEAGKEPESADDAGAAERVAEALGVEDEDAEAKGEGADEGEEDAPPPNRAARRREEALVRRRKRRPGADEVASAKPAEDVDLPRDKNARAKELLRRRREEAAGRRDVALAPAEMVDDAMARMASASGKWFRGNFHIIQWVVLAGLLGVGGYVFYSARVEAAAGEASDALASAVSAERGRVMAEDKRSDEEKEFDPTRIFATPEERAEAALAGYNKVIDQHAGTGAAILAKLGQAGVYLDKKEWDHALEAYASVASSTLASADADVKGRAIEGTGFAKEGKGDLDGALATYKELEGIDAKGYKELAMYHQARLLVAKGDQASIDKAKELLKQTRERLQAPSIDGKPFQFLEAVVDEALRTLDPSAVPVRTQIGGAKGSSMTPEELERLLKKAREAGEKKGGDEHGDDAPGQ